MKTIAFLYEVPGSNWQFETVFDGKSALERAVLWSQNIECTQKTVIFTSAEDENSVKDVVIKAKTDSSFKDLPVETVVLENATNASLIRKMADITSSQKADAAVFAWGSCPFLDAELSSKVIGDHEKFLAEYTYADGYPYGFSPEVIDAGALRIIASLAEGVQKEAGSVPVSKDGIFSIMKGDINSFEIETVIAEEDFRMLRLDFSCSEKAGFLACKALWKIIEDGKEGLSKEKLDAYKMSVAASKNAEVQKTVPAYYSVQISSGYNTVCKYNPYFAAFEKKFGFVPAVLCEGKEISIENRQKLLDKNMKLEKFASFVEQVSSVSEKAVISLGGWGEPLLHPQFVSFVEEVLKYKNLTVLIETDGILVSEQLAQKINNLCIEYNTKNIIWIVNIDAFSAAKYSVMHNAPEVNFSKAVDSIAVLQKYFAPSVYPQMLRVNENEDELESFYRYWHAKENASGGKLIVLKYDSFCGLLRDEKPADLSPLDRNACWHIKRDLNILADGSVPLCREFILDANCGNVFTDGIEAVFSKFTSVVEEHLNKNYSEKCRACDEYYTFNF